MKKNLKSLTILGVGLTSLTLVNLFGNIPERAKPFIYDFNNRINYETPILQEEPAKEKKQESEKYLIC